MRQPNLQPDLSRRESQIMRVIYRRGAATATEVQADIPDAPSNAGIRTLLRVLVKKGHLRVRRDGTRYVYLPRVAGGRMRLSALRDLVDTFFGGSRQDAVVALLADDAGHISQETEARLRSLIAAARQTKSK
jgi:predicted transcriptional regulator